MHFPGWALLGQRVRAQGELAGTLCVCVPHSLTHSYPTAPALPIIATATAGLSGYCRLGLGPHWGCEPSGCPHLPSAVGRGTVPTPGFPMRSPSRWGKSLGTMLTDLECALNSLVDVYHKYSLLKGNYHAIYKDDLKKLLETECPHFLQVRRGRVRLGDSVGLW